MWFAKGLDVDCEEKRFITDNWIILHLQLENGVAIHWDGNIMKVVNIVMNIR